MQPYHHLKIQNYKHTRFFIYFDTQYTWYIKLGKEKLLGGITINK
jgi:hypothetical protein